MACIGGLLGGFVATISHAGGVPGSVLDEVVVTAKHEALVGRAEAASEGTVLGVQLENRPILRTAEILEVVPGLVVTQHSGDGKANQYFLRGFNLDHGTDLAMRVDGLPVNMPTHAHGQGYADINFMVPELVDRIQYRKGTYYTEEGNFSAAGSVDVTYRHALDRPFLQLGGGEDGYYRALIAGSPKVENGDLLLAFDYSHNNGPWDLPEGLRKINGLAKYTHGDLDDGFSLTAMAYDGSWRSTDQIPLRAVQSGAIDRFGNIDPTDGGETHRYSVSGVWWGTVGKGTMRASVYGIDYQLDLFSNFTYFTDPLHGDQFEQFDSRRTYGGDLTYGQPFTLAGLDHQAHFGLTLRYDDISPVALYHTQDRVRFSTVREDKVKQTSYSAYVSDEIHVASWLRADLGLRADRFDFDVASNLAANSGTASDSIVSPKIAVIFGPRAMTEFFINAGEGFHSNDARGTTISVDPIDGTTPVPRVDPLVKARGAEVGVRTAIVPHLHLATALWTLALDSELLFVGDGGATEASRASRRSGLELSAYYTPRDWLIIDADLAFSRCRFTDPDPAGDQIPGAVERVASVGVAMAHPSGWSGGARLRYLGAGALIEDDSVRSQATTLVNLEVGYRFSKTLKGSIELLNVFDARANDIAYYYESQLSGEPAPIADIHFHPVEPRTVRAAVTLQF